MTDSPSPPLAQRIFCECGKIILCGTKNTQCTCGNWYGPYGEPLHRYTVEIHRVWRLQIADTSRRCARQEGALRFSETDMPADQYVVVRRHVEHVQGDEVNLKEE